MSDMIKVPSYFFYDHKERDLPTPRVHKASRTHVWIKRDDPAFAEFLDDAKHYAKSATGMTEETRGLRASAKATVKAINAAMEGAK